MKPLILFSDIIKSDYFIEGNTLFSKRNILISEVRRVGKGYSIKGFPDGFPAKDIEINIDGKGAILNTMCSEDGDVLCKHIVAMALKFNEISVEDESPVQQLDEIVKASLDPSPWKKIRVLFSNKTGISLNADDLKNNPQAIEIVKSLDKRKIPSFIAVAPELFTFEGREIRRGEFPIHLHYSAENSIVSFFLPVFYYYSFESSLIINTESAEIFPLSLNENRIIDTLLSFKVGYKNDDEIYGIIDRITDKIKNVFQLTGNLSIEKSIVDEGDVVYFIDFKKEKMYLSIRIETDDGTIDLKPERKEKDHSYVIGKSLLTISTDFIKKIKAFVRSAGFKLSKGKFSMPIFNLPAILDKESILQRTGRVVFKSEVKKIEIDKSEIDKSTIELSINPDEGWFSFNIKLPDHVYPLPGEALIDALRQVRKGKDTPVVIDEHGEPVILHKSKEFLERLNTLFAHGNAAPDDKISTRFLPHILKNNAEKNITGFYGDTVKREEYKNSIENFMENKFPDVALPENIRDVLRQYQVEGVSWLKLVKALRLGGILADEMGLGKTIQTLTLLHLENSEKPSIVIAPKTLVWSWDMEINKFFPEMERVIVDSYPPHERAKLWKNVSNKLVVTSYSIVMNDFEKVKKIDFNAIVLDEAQHIKNPMTKRSKAIFGLKGEFRLALTGTPMENHIRELWSIFNFLMPGFLGRKQSVEKMERAGDMDEMKELANMTSPFMLRRLKKDILKELPPVVIKECPVKMTDKQKEIYLSILLRGRAEFLEYGTNMNKIQILAMLTKLRLAANHPMMVSDVIGDFEESGKILLLLELVDEIKEGGGRVLIFSQFVKLLKIVEEVLRRKNISYLYMDGKTKNRRELVTKFNDEDQTAFLLSLKVGGTGLNLTGADNVIILDPWWNPAVEEQAFSRAHRIGQNKQVMVYKLFSRETIEEKILAIQEQKRDMIDFFMSRTMTEPSKDFINLLAEMEFSKL